MACTGGGRMEAELSHIDSLTEADQSAAIARIDSITAASGGGMARSVRMRLALLRANACNKLLLPLNRDSLLMLDGYFTDHGTPNERMLATPRVLLNVSMRQLLWPIQRIWIVIGAHCKRYMSNLAFYCIIKMHCMMRTKNIS